MICTPSTFNFYAFSPLTHFHYPSTSYNVKTISAYFSKKIIQCTCTLTYRLQSEDAGWQKLDVSIRRRICLYLSCSHILPGRIFCCQRSAIKFRQGFSLLNHSLYIPALVTSLPSLYLSSDPSGENSLSGCRQYLLLLLQSCHHHHNVPS